MEIGGSNFRFPTSDIIKFDDGLIVKRSAYFLKSSRLRNKIRYIFSYDINRPVKKLKTNELFSVFFVTDNMWMAAGFYFIRLSETDDKIVKKMHYRGIMPHHFDTAILPDYKREAVNTLAFIYSLN